MRGCPIARTTPMLTDALEAYFQTRTNLADNTQANDRSVLTRFVRSLGSIQVGHLTPEHVEKYFVGSDGIVHTQRPSSYNKTRQRVEGFLKFCVGRGWIRRDLLANIGRKRMVRSDRLRLTPAQLLSLLDAAATPRDRCMLAVGINLGLRAIEITGLLESDVNFDAGELHVVISKSGIEDRMPISSDLEPELRRWLRHYTETLRY